MKHKKSMQLLLVGICLILSVFGLYFQFFQGKKSEGSDQMKSGQEKEKEETEENKENPYDYSDKKLPDAENETADELVSEGVPIRIYFTNSEILDTSSLTNEAHAILCESAQKFLEMSGYEEITELPVLKENFIDDEEKVQFLCQLKGFEENLRITYTKGENKLNFAIIIME